MAIRERSVLYPGTTWSDCMDLVHKVDALKLKTVAYSEIAKAYGLHSASTKSFMRRISTAKQFGLIKTEEQTIQLTDIATKIIYPISDGSNNLPMVCFANPPLYRQLIDKYNDKALPNTVTLSNVLMAEFKIAKSVKEQVAQCFLSNADELGLIKGGVLIYHPEDGDKHQVEEPKENIEIAPMQEDVFSSDTSVSPKLFQGPSDSSDYFKIEIPVESHKIAYIHIPIDATVDDAEMIRDVLAVVLKRKFGISP